MTIRQGYYQYFKNMLGKKYKKPTKINYNYDDKLILIYEFKRGRAIVQEQTDKVVCTTKYGYSFTMNRITKVKQDIRKYRKKEA